MSQAGERCKKLQPRDKMKTMDVNDIGVLASEELENENIEICKREENISGATKSFSTLQHSVHTLQHPVHTLQRNNTYTEQNGSAIVESKKINNIFFLGEPAK